MRKKIELNSIGKNLVFSRLSQTYKHLCKNDYGLNFKKIWKAKMPLKIKILIKRKWKGDNTCAFCDEKETGNHLFFYA